LSIERYASSHDSYQQSVARQTWMPGSIASDWWFNISHSLEFWKWVRGEWKGSIISAELLSVLLAAIFIAGGVIMARLWKASKLEIGEFDWRHSSWILAAGLALLVFSFPVYLILENARSLWRTQMLSGIGAGVVLAGLAGLGTLAVRPIIWRRTLFLLLASVVAFEGSLAAIQRGAFHRFIWERHRDAIREVLQVAPSVSSGTVVVLTNIRNADDPFGDNLWFDFALRLIYPNRYVSGAYFYSNGATPPGDNLTLQAGEWGWNGKGIAPLVKSAAIAQTVVVRYVPDGRGRIETTFPRFLCNPNCDGAAEYHPEKLIIGPISPRTLRRYNLKPDFATAPNLPD
jgi:hypothetical protein